MVEFIDPLCAEDDAIVVTDVSLFKKSFAELKVKTQNTKVVFSGSIETKSDFESDLMFTIGNRHKLVQNPEKSYSRPELDNEHEWTAFVALQPIEGFGDDTSHQMDKLVDHVVF